MSSLLCRLQHPLQPIYTCLYKATPDAYKVRVRVRIRIRVKVRA